MNSAQCKSKCCHRPGGLTLARCAPKASENSECSAKVGPRDCVRERGEEGPPGRARVSGTRPAWPSNGKETREEGNRLRALSHPMALTTDWEMGGDRHLVSPFHGWVNRGSPRHIVSKSKCVGTTRPGEALRRRNTTCLLVLGVRPKASDAHSSPAACDSPGSSFCRRSMGFTTSVPVSGA